MNWFIGESDARRGLSLARAYKKHCYLGRTSKRPNKNVYLIEYWLEPTGAPAVIDGEQCFAYNRSALRVIENAVRSALRRGLRTPDIATPGDEVIGTQAMGDAVVAALRNG